MRENSDQDEELDLDRNDGFVLRILTVGVDLIFSCLRQGFRE